MIATRRKLSAFVEASEERETDCDRAMGESARAVKLHFRTGVARIAAARSSVASARFATLPA
jgi:hypothetical protein